MFLIFTCSLYKVHKMNMYMFHLKILNGFQWNLVPGIHTRSGWVGELNVCLYQSITACTLHAVQIELYYPHPVVLVVQQSMTHSEISYFFFATQWTLLNTCRSGDWLWKLSLIFLNRSSHVAITKPMDKVHIHIVFTGKCKRNVWSLMI
jgi:hypothetical protein